MGTLSVGNKIGETGPLRVEILPNGRSAVLIRPFLVKTKSGKLIEVPAGFQTDFASVPRLFWRLIPPWGPYSPAAVVHDYLYATGIVSRKEADQIFLELMTRLGVAPWRRNVMYAAVRVAGASRYNKSGSKK